MSENEAWCAYAQAALTGLLARPLEDAPYAATPEEFQQIVADAAAEYADMMLLQEQRRFAVQVTPAEEG